MSGEGLHDATPPEGQTFVVRELDQLEQTRVQECLRWCHAQGAMFGPELSDKLIAEAYERVLVEARRRWPDVAALIGF